MDAYPKLEIDPVFTILVIDSNAYNLHKEFLLKLENEKTSKDSLCIEVAKELIGAFHERKVTFQDENSELSLESLNDLYTYKTNYLGLHEDEEQHLKNMLSEMVAKEDLEEFEVNIILDLSFFHKCVLTLNKYWYLQLGIPVSTKLTNNLSPQNLILRQIHEFDKVNEILDPVEVNTIKGGGLNMLKDFASEEFFGAINPIPMLGPDNPINKEINNLKEVNKIIQGNSKYKFCIYYTPN